MKYFIHDPQDETFFFENEGAWQKAMDDFDFIGKYCDDGWSPEVENVIAGVLPEDAKRIGGMESDEWESEEDFYERYRTHSAHEVNRRDRPDDVDEEGHSPSTGDWWSDDWQYICSYEFREIEK